MSIRIVNSETTLGRLLTFLTTAGAIFVASFKDVSKQSDVVIDNSPDGSKEIRIEVVD